MVVFLLHHQYVFGKGVKCTLFRVLEEGEVPGQVLLESGRRLQ